MLSKIQERKGYVLLGLLAIWWGLAKLTFGKFTLELPMADNTPVTNVVGNAASAISGNRTTSPFFIYFFNPIRLTINGFVDVIRNWISAPISGEGAPIIGWAGLVAILAFLAYATSRIRIALLVVVLVVTCGALGMWVDTMDTLAMTIAAVVLSLAIGIPLGIWAGLSDRVLKLLTPILDLAQILPTLVYLAPLALFFMIGEASATIATMVYSIPISIRITSHAIRTLNFSPVEASISMGATERQTLRKVQLPMAKQMIVLGINQTVMAALSFVVIAALIAAPGLGKPVVAALTIQNTGRGFVAGLAVVCMAIMLDRATSAAAVKQKSFIPPTEKQLKTRRTKITIAGIVTLVITIASHFIEKLQIFPANFSIAVPIENATNKFVDFLVNDVSFATVGFKDFISIWALNPIEDVLARSPWFMTLGMFVLVALILGGVRIAILTFALLISIVATGLWFDAMVTLTQTIVATLLTMIIGVALGIWVGRSKRVDSILRPFMDAGQTMPAFVYLVPILGLFGPTRFTAIATGIVYSIPVVVKIVGEGIRAVPESIIEAATAAGSNVRQIITKVQLPASKKALMLAANQGMIFVLAVIVIGGFVGSGGLGYLVIMGSSKPELTGKGLVAGLVILILGVTIDRIAQAAAKRA
jgi:glycine betaine/proline transport system permease protein